jgi:chemotaxis protein CheX
MEPTTTEIIDLTREVCGTVLAFPTELIELGGQPVPSEVMATVLITGTWTGAVVLLCSNELAHAATAAMFEAEPGSTTQSDLDDAMGELANMIGGNIKNRLPTPCKLSLPTVVCGAMVKARFPGTRLHTELAFALPGGTLAVQLHHKAA